MIPLLRSVRRKAAEDIQHHQTSAPSGRVTYSWISGQVRISPFSLAMCKAFWLQACGAHHCFLQFERQTSQIRSAVADRRPVEALTTIWKVNEASPWSWVEAVFVAQRSDESSIVKTNQLGHVNVMTQNRPVKLSYCVKCFWLLSQRKNTESNWILHF